MLKQLAKLFVTSFHYFPAGTFNVNEVITQGFSCRMEKNGTEALSVTTRVLEMENFVINM
jgi:hypothetical protein